MTVVTPFNLKNIWTEVLNQIRSGDYFDDVVYRTYFSESTLYEVGPDNRATIVVPTKMAKLVFESEISHVNDCLSQILQQPVECEVVFDKEGISKTPTFPIQKEEIISEDNVLPSYTFENFIVGNSNRESHSAALACAINPGQFYTPLFIFGNSGLGKTHLLHAVGNYVKNRLPDKEILLLSTTDFVTQTVSALRDKTIEQYKQKLLNLDVLLMDDVQFLAGTDKISEIFFHLFNALVNNRKQLVFTCDRHPSEINGLEQRLISRFTSGLSVGIDSPEFDTALAILKQRIEEKCPDPTIFEQDVLYYIAKNCSSDIRNLVGALNRVIFYAIDFSGENKIDEVVMFKAFQGQTSFAKAEMSFNTIKKAVCDYYGITRSQLISKTRVKNLDVARKIAMYLCRKYLDMPFSRIGEEFGKRDHSTVMNAIEKLEKNLKKDEMLRSALRDIEKKFDN
ncbi:MAG: chromosomal replication initiator protein DnaA [Erysipelotrichaceae bacterium]|nr:chromosomal replication initiator protein DnaA [Erysipelotrichaceae bacterium]